MGLIDNLRKVSGQIKNRLASAVGVLKGVTVGGGRTVRGVRFAARATRLTTPLGLGLTAVSFAPEIARGVRVAGRFLARAVPRGVAFVGGQRVVSGVAGGAGAGTVAGLISRKTGRPQQVQSMASEADLRGLNRRERAEARRLAEENARIERAFKADRARGIPASGRVRRRRKPSGRRRKAPTRRVRRKRLKKPVRRRKKRTHSSPRHKGHKRVKFTTKDGKRVSFLVNPKARHR